MFAETRIRSKISSQRSSIDNSNLRPSATSADKLSSLRVLRAMTVNTESPILSIHPDPVDPVKKSKTEATPSEEK
jgi:hypothetical protein